MFRGVLFFSACLAVLLSCAARPAAGKAEDSQVIRLGGMADDETTWRDQRLTMVERQIRRRGVKDLRVLAAMETVRRHAFVPEDQRARSYGDYPLPIGYNQTISQPYIVALMSELLQVRPGDTVLEIGTGSGYQAAVLASLAAHVYSVEIVGPLCERARETLKAQGCDNVTVLCGDGYGGWPEHAPFNGIILTAAPPAVPRPLLDQLAEGGRLVVPEGRHRQELVVYEKLNGEIRRRTVIPVRFVPMTGRAEDN